jgi:3-oxoadipate enol-lactonase
MSVSFFTTGDGCRMAYRCDGPADRPVLLLSNSIGTDLRMWDGQIPALTGSFRVLRYDLRGHGRSDLPLGAYSIDRLGHDVLELLDHLRLTHVHFCGLSLGGMVGQWLGIHVPERIERLILCHTAPFIGPTTQWGERIAAILAADPAETAEAFIRNWFPAAMREAGAPAIEPFRATLRATDPRGIAACLAAVRDMDLRRTMSLIPVPTLVVGGQHDTVTLPEHSEQIAAAIPGAKLVMLPAVHMSNIEMPAVFTKLVLDFLTSATRDPRVAA